MPDPDLTQRAFTAAIDALTPEKRARIRLRLGPPEPWEEDIESAELPSPYRRRWKRRAVDSGTATE